MPSESQAPHALNANHAALDMVQKLSLGMEMLRELKPGTGSAKRMAPYLRKWDGILSSEVSGELDTQRRAAASAHKVVARVTGAPPEKRSRIVQSLAQLAEHARQAALRTLKALQGQAGAVADAHKKILVGSATMLSSAVDTAKKFGVKVAETVTAGASWALGLAGLVVLILILRR